MQKRLCTYLVFLALLLLSITVPSSTPDTSSVRPFSWPAGWPVVSFPAPLPGSQPTVAVEYTLDGVHYTGVLLESPHGLSATQTWMDTEAAKVGLIPQRTTDVIADQVGGFFGIAALVSPRLWVKLDADRMWAVVLATGRNRTQMVYLVRENSLVPPPLPADWPTEVVIPPHTVVVALVTNLKTGQKTVTLTTNTPMSDVQAILSQTLPAKGYVRNNARLSVWQKGQVIKSVIGGSDLDAILTIRY